VNDHRFSKTALVAELSLSETVEALSGGRDLAEYVTATCDRLDAVQPIIEPFLPEPERRARLLAEARLPRSGPLHGALVGVKDLINVDGFATRAGSALPADLFAGAEAACVTTLKRAGALILGKTHTDEFAHSEPSPARNPHNPRHTPGGSSAGSAAAVAAGVCPLAIGTQTLRSIIGPAAFCGVLGFKPSYGRVPTDGLVKMSPSIDTVGWLTQDVDGLGLAASILIGDWRPVGQERAPVVGVPASAMLDQASPEARAAFDAQLVCLERGGIEVKRAVRFVPDDDLIATARTTIELVHGEMAAVHAPWFDDHAHLYRPRTAAAIRGGRGVSALALAQARAAQPQFRSRIMALMADAGIDVWAVPSSNGPAPEGLEVTGWVHMTGTWSFAGLPCVSIPAGVAADGLPLGLQLVGSFGQDERLLAWTSAVQRAIVT
jgi:Asp-tRNA(Asn)/Glu-tRNA(Gln) amidotransferase A subunit family amidase